MQKFEYTPLADVYSFGVILYELLTTERYFQVNFPFVYLKDILLTTIISLFIQQDVTFMSLLEDMVISGKRPEIPKTCLPEYATLIQDCWQGNASSRPPFAQIVDRIQAILIKHQPEHARYDQGVELLPPPRTYKKAPSPRADALPAPSSNPLKLSGESPAGPDGKKVGGIRQRKMTHLQLQSVYLDSVKLESLAEMFKKEQSEGETTPKRRRTLLRLSKPLDDHLQPPTQPQQQQQKEEDSESTATTNVVGIDIKVSEEPTATKPTADTNTTSPRGQSTVPRLVMPFTGPTSKPPPLPATTPKPLSPKGGVTTTSPRDNNNDSTPNAQQQSPVRPQPSPVTTPPSGANAADKEQQEKEQEERRRREETRRKVELIKEKMLTGNAVGASTRTPKVPGNNNPRPREAYSTRTNRVATIAVAGSPPRTVDDQQKPKGV